MILVGMPDSPYVRRVAITLKRMGIPFEHQKVSVFRHFDRFKSINPVVKAPSLVCEDGTVLMDSSLILDHIESMAPAAKRLMPAGVMERREALRLIGLAMAACEKGVQIVYEKEQRPADKRHQPWMDRVVGQANAAYVELERAAAARGNAWLQGAQQAVVGPGVVVRLGEEVLRERMGVHGPYSRVELHPLQSRSAPLN